MHKLTLSLLIMVLISILGLGWALDSLFERLSNQPQQDQLRPYRELGSRLARLLDMTETIDQRKLASLDQNSDLTLSLKPLTEFLLPPELKPDFIQGKPLALESENGLTLYFYLPEKKLVLGMTANGISPTADRALLSIMLTALFYIGIIILISLWLSPLIRQLTQLRETAKAFGHGDLSKRISYSTISYITDIETEFNRMAHKIEGLVHDNKLLSSAVSHDLRTPLARLRFGVDALSEMNDPVTRKKYQQRISEDVSEMESLVETLLNYARLDQAMVAVEKKSLDLASLIADCADNTDHKSKSLNLVSPGNNVTIMGDRKYLSMLINNILGNAVHHARHQIRLSLISNATTVTILVEDDGKGVPESERETVIKPFIRGHHTSDSKGYGMGLAISQRIAEWHNGYLEILHSSTLKGAKIQVVLSKKIN